MRKLDSTKFNTFLLGFFSGLIAYSVLMASQYGWTFQIIREGFWSIAFCLKPQTLIIFPSFGILYYLLMKPSKHRALTTIALLFLAFVLQDTAFMFFYCPVYSTSALARNIFLMYFCLFVFLKSKQELSLSLLCLSALLSLGLLYVYAKISFNGDMNLSGFIWNDSTLKMIPLLTLMPSIKKGER